MAQQINREQFLGLDAEEVVREFKTAINAEDVGYLDLLADHENIFLAYPSAYVTEFPSHFQLLIQFMYLDRRDDFFPIKGKRPENADGSGRYVDFVKYGMKGDLIKKLSFAAGVDWIEPLTGLIKRREDPETRLVNYIEYKATATLQMLDGQRRTVTSRKHLDFPALYAAAEASQYADQRERELWKLGNRRCNANEHVETGAKSRVICELLGLPRSFDLEDINKIWAVPKITFKVNMNDPVQAAMLLQSQMASQSLLYFQAAYGGPNAGSAPALPSPHSERALLPIPDSAYEPTAAELQDEEDVTVDVTTEPPTDGDSAASTQPAEPQRTLGIPPVKGQRTSKTKSQTKATPPASNDPKPIKSVGKWDLLPRPTEPVGKCLMCKEEIPEAPYWKHSGTGALLDEKCGAKKKELQEN